jgi:hypothetical protein
MLTPSVNVVQSRFPEELQGEIAGLSRSISNLGSSFGTAIAGTILVSVVASGTTVYAWAMAVLAVFGVIGLGGATSPSCQTEAADQPLACSSIRPACLMRSETLSRLRRPTGPRAFRDVNHALGEFGQILVRAGPAGSSRCWPSWTRCSGEDGSASAALRASCGR